MCKTIEGSEKFSNQNISLSETLTASDVENVTVFLTSSSHREWKGLHLEHCYIQDHGLHILHHGLLRCSDVTITKLSLNSNGLTMQSSSLISDITVSCKVKELELCVNHTIGEDKQLYSMLTNPFTMLETLLLGDTSLSSTAAITLFNILRDNNKLKLLDISCNDITDDASDAIATALERNSCLVTLYMYRNAMTGTAIFKIVNSLMSNNTLAVLVLHNMNVLMRMTVSYLQELIIEQRESRRCKVKLWIE